MSFRCITSRLIRMFNQVLTTLNCMPHLHTLDTKIPLRPLMYLLRNPSTCMGVVVGGYVLGTVITLPIFLLSYLVTGYGATLMALVCLVHLARCFGRYMSYPGSAASIQREVSVDYLRRLCGHLVLVCKQVETINNNLKLHFDQRLDRASEMLLVAKVTENQSMTPYLFSLSQMVALSISALKEKTSLPRDDMDGFETFQLAVFQLAHCIQVLYGIIQHKAGALSLDAQQRPLIDECTKAVNGLVQAINSAMPKKVDADNYYGQFTYFLSSMWYGPQRFEALAFPLMRQQLLFSMRAEIVALQGVDNNSIACVWVPAEVVKPVGTVLFCCPNLGMIECIGLAPRESSWIGFYLGMGFNICTFNYRGYNDSSGVPTPDTIKADVKTVLTYAQQRSSCKVLVHGESIGGIPAVHAARYCGVAMVVCDRTFSSLDAAGSRILGNWAGVGLRNVLNWSTDLVEDFLSCQCPRVLLQDPNDEVIAYTASLKSGVACRLVLQDSFCGARRRTPREYLIAFYNGESLSTVLAPADASELLRSGEAGGALLKEGFITHLVVLILLIYRTALDFRAEGSLRSKQQTSFLTDDGSPYQSSRGGRAKLADLQSGVVSLWVTLARIDGGAGYYLSHAASKGFDAIRVWLCEAVVWGSRLAGADQSGSAVVGSMLAAIEELERRLPTMAPGGLVTPFDVEFLVRGFRIIMCKCKNMQSPETVDIGKVIPLNGGHNGWPSPLALAALSSTIRSAGFDVVP